jgi:hypothetical protein
MMNVMGSNGFSSFLDYCEQSYNILRKYSHLFIILFILMIDSNIEGFFFLINFLGKNK